MTVDLYKMLSTALTAHDGGRERSKQVDVGPSAVGGCRRRVWHMLQRTPATNPDTEVLAAIMGTFIHQGIQEAIKREDPFGENFLIEHRVSHPKITGNIDLFIKDKGLVVDWKTTKVRNMRYFPSSAQLYQVHIYGWLLAQEGYQVNQVSLVALARDGEMKDIRVHVEDYSEAIALEGIAWLDDIRAIVANNDPAPEPTERVSFCAKYRGYYDPSGEIGCPSSTK